MLGKSKVWKHRTDNLLISGLGGSLGGLGFLLLGFFLLGFFLLGSSGGPVFVPASQLAVLPLPLLDVTEERALVYLAVDPVLHPQEGRGASKSGLRAREARVNITASQ